MNENSYLLYVNEFSWISQIYVLRIYRVKTKDIFHAIGEYTYRSMYQIKRIQFVEETDERVKYWKDNGYEISEFKEKYAEGKQ